MQPAGAMDLPPPAPPDAFSLLEDEDTSVLHPAAPPEQVANAPPAKITAQPGTLSPSRPNQQQQHHQQQELLQDDALPTPQEPQHPQQQQQQRQEQQAPATGLQHCHSPRPQPKDLTDVLQQLSDTCEAIAAAEEVLQSLVAQQSALKQVGRKMEQQQVLAVVEKGHLGFDRGRPVLAVLLLRCLQQWGLLHQTEPCPFLEQLSSLLQEQLELEDSSAPADVAGLQCRVADSLSLCATLYCILLKAGHPELAAAAAAGTGPKAQRHVSAAEVVAAARKKMSATWQQGVAHVGPGLQALSKLKIGGWGFKRSEEPAAATPTSASHTHSSSSSQAPAAAAPAATGDPQKEEVQGTTPAAAQGDVKSATATTQADATAEAATADAATAGAAAAGVPAAGAAGGAAAAAGGGGAAEVLLWDGSPLGCFLLCLDQLVQHSYIMLRDQLKRRLTPLLADCISPENNVMPVEPDVMSVEPDVTGSGPAAAEAAAEAGEGTESPAAAAAGAAVAGSVAESAAHAEAALMSYRSWSELVGVLHAALVALRAAHVPRSLRAALMQQVLADVNCHLFNQLLLRPECCSASNAKYALRGLKQLDTWIVAEQSATHAAGHDSGGHPVLLHGAAAAAGDGGGMQDGSFNSSSTSTNKQAAAANAAASGAASAAAAGDGDGGGNGGGAVAEAGNSSATTAAAAAAATAEDEDSGWEQVPADAGEFDAWQPSKQQQQQSTSWLWPHKQKQQQGGTAGAQEAHELGPGAWAALSHTRQALQFLVLENKGALSLEDLTEHVCPALNSQQLYRLCTTAWSDTQQEQGGGGVSGEVLEQMKALYTLHSNGGLIVTFLLDEPSGPLPFTAQQQPPAGSSGSKGSGSSGSNAAARCRQGDVVCWDDGRDYGVGLRAVPAALVDEGCPVQVFEWLLLDQHWPPPGSGRHSFSK